jgi:guanidinopropionase
LKILKEKKIMKKIDPMDEPRYCGIPTFMRTPYITDFSELDIALLGIPYDGAIEARSGARQGPRQSEISQV